MWLHLSDQALLMSGGLSRESLKERQRYADWYEEKSEQEQQLIDEIADCTDYILGEDQNNSFICLLRQNGIETADQFADSFCVEYEGIVESDEFVVVVFEGNSYFFRRLCGRFR
ncbi:hypothetical protein [Synechococcus sp. MIT S9509]|uniref:hypothetical protein n=1 Tax=Synechococcus sp. MIT S9509 TaxID=1801630 RepID=UPI00082A4C03|nr:hypothetical protein [Synechococcus sp. MIT S9509]